MERLENIGFYTLSDSRCAQASAVSPLWRAEIILTDACNFRCSYCRGVKDEYAGTLSLADASDTLRLWFDQGLRHVRFSGGEPLTYKGLDALVADCAAWGVQRIALSTNGSMPFGRYAALVNAGVNDFSISLDACCAEDGDHMAGGVRGAWKQVVHNIEALSKVTYVTVGVVLTNENVGKLNEIVEFAHGLGVADIRIISAAQFDAVLGGAIQIRQEILDAHPILKYRVQNIKAGRHVRGLSETDHNRCPLVLDDAAAVGGHHFPCIIYLREQGKPIGKIGPTMRSEREQWARKHDTFLDPICRKNCLDVCVDYNNRYRELHGG